MVVILNTQVIKINFKKNPGYWFWGSSAEYLNLILHFFMPVDLSFVGKRGSLSGVFTYLAGVKEMQHFDLFLGDNGIAVILN